MQIEIACTGGYKIENFLDELDNLYGCIDNTIEGLSNVCCEIAQVNGGMNRTLNEAYTNINYRIAQEKNKQDSVRTIRERAQLFYDTTLQIDEQVACQVDENSEKFFAEYSGMGTVSSIEEGWWDKFVDGWNDIWNTVEDAMEAAIDGICDFFTEHAIEMIVGVIGFVVGGALMIYLGGVTLATVAMTALLALGAVALEAGIMALIEYLRGGNFWEAFQEYFASGFMFAGIFFVLQAMFSAVANIIKARKAEKARKAAEAAKKVDDVAAGGKSILKSTNISSKDIVFGSNTKSVQKLVNQMSHRGWTKELIEQTIDVPYTTRASINKATGNSATVFYTKQGSYVIVDDVTKAIVQISDNANLSTWIPDSCIIEPYIPKGGIK